MADINIIMLTETILAQSPALIDDVTGQISMPIQATGQSTDPETPQPMATPTLATHLATKEYVDLSATGFATDTALGIVVDGFASDAEVALLDAEVALLADQTALDAVQAASMPRAGGTMSGPILWDQTPVTSDELVNKAYVDATVSGAGGVLTEPLGDARFLQLAGGTLTGALTLPADPALALEIATKQYVDGTMAPADRYLQVAGGSMTGPLLLSGMPNTRTQAATYGYFKMGLDWINSAVQTYLRNGTITSFISTMFANGTALSALPDLRGGNGAIISSGTIVRDGPWWTPTATSYPLLPAPVGLKTRRIMFLVKNWNPATFTTSDLGGGTVSGAVYRAVPSLSGNRLLVGISYNSDQVVPGTVVSAVTPRITAPTTGAPMLIEIGSSTTGTQLQGWVNGVSTGTVNYPAGWTDFLIAALGYAFGALNARPLDATMGDVVILDTTKADFADAVTAARQWFAAQYAIPMSYGVD